MKHRCRAQVWKTITGARHRCRTHVKRTSTRHRCGAQVEERTGARTPVICFCKPAGYLIQQASPQAPPAQSAETQLKGWLAGCVQGLSILGGGGRERIALAAPLIMLQNSQRGCMARAQAGASPQAPAHKGSPNQSQQMGQRSSLRGSNAEVKQSMEKDLHRHSFLTKP